MVQRLEQGEGVGAGRGVGDREGEHVGPAHTGLGGERVAGHAVHQRRAARTQRLQCSGVARQAVAQRRVGAGQEDARDRTRGGGQFTRHIARAAGNAVGQTVLVHRAGLRGAGGTRTRIEKLQCQADVRRRGVDAPVPVFVDQRVGSLDQHRILKVQLLELVRVVGRWM